MFVKSIKQHHRSIFEKLKLSSEFFRHNFSSQRLNRQFPKCIYVQPPMQWLMCKINFQRLKAWDATFDESEFKSGAKQAIVMMMNDIVRTRDSALLAKVATLRGFSQIYKDMLLSQKDPRRKLLYFTLNDVRKVVAVDVELAEEKWNCKCRVEVFFMCMSFLDEIIDAFKEGNTKKSDFLIYQDIRSVEALLRKGKRSLQQKYIPPSEKVVYTEGYLRLLATYSLEKHALNDWRIDYFKFSNFDIVPVKVAKKEE